MFKCKVCAEKDKRVAALEAEIVFLRTLVRPPVPVNARGTMPEQLEADAIMSGADEQIIIDEKSRFFHPLPKMTLEEENAALERDLILSGNY